MFFREIDKTNSTPYIYISEEEGYMRFQGESFHENVLEFYSEILLWLKDYLESDIEKFVFDCELKYFNSSTAKMLYNMMDRMNEAGESGKKITINWITTSDNETNIECAEDLSEDMENIEFNLVIRQS